MPFHDAEFYKGMFPNAKSFIYSHKNNTLEKYFSDVYKDTIFLIFEPTYPENSFIAILMKDLDAFTFLMTSYFDGIGDVNRWKVRAFGMSKLLMMSNSDVIDPSWKNIIGFAFKDSFPLSEDNTIKGYGILDDNEMFVMNDYFNIMKESSKKKITENSKDD